MDSSIQHISALYNDGSKLICLNKNESKFAAVKCQDPNAKKWHKQIWRLNKGPK